MHKGDFILCYDIADPGRLARIARHLERHALRIQYSIYFAPSRSREELDAIVGPILKLLDHDLDDLRIYRISDYGIALGMAVDLRHPTLIGAHHAI